MGKKHLIGSRRDCLVPDQPLKRCVRLVVRTAILVQRDQTYADGDPASDACYGKKSVSTQSRPVNAGAKKRPKAAVDVKKNPRQLTCCRGFFYHSATYACSVGIQNSPVHQDAYWLVSFGFGSIDLWA